MFVSEIENVPKEKVSMEGAAGVSVQWLINEKSGAPNFAMRLFTVAPHGHTPRHKHDFEHEILVMSGKGNLIDETGKPHALMPGMFAYVPPDETHQFQNSGDDDFRFICLVPIRK